MMYGYDVRTYNISFISQRPSSRNPLKYYFIGKSMKALGYTVLYALGRVLFLLFRGKYKCALYMLKGYLSRVKQYDDIKDYVRYLQYKRLLQMRRICSGKHSWL